MHQVYLIPGFFGFTRLAGVDYFGHVQRALEARFADAGVPVEVVVVPTPPTASIRRRARTLAERIRARHPLALHGADPRRNAIHLVGHSTGGLDARLLTSPTVHLDLGEDDLAWRAHIRTVVALNSPHHGTPLAGFFTTVSGARLLYALSLLTVTTLSLGGPPLTAATGLLATLGGVDDLLGVDVKLLDRASDAMLRVVDVDARDDVRAWLERIRHDQGALLQLTPEAMDLFTAAAEDAPDVRYGCVASASPEPRSGGLLSAMRSPALALMQTIYATIFGITASAHPHYLYPLPEPEDARRLLQRTGLRPDETANDGIVPTQSMLWGELIWAGLADHLDVVGHFRDEVSGSARGRHTDWLTSGSGFRRRDFAELMDALAAFLLRDAPSG